MSTSEVERQIISLISKKFKIDPSKLSKDSYFSTDIGISSYQAMELVCDFEEMFNCSIPDHEVKKIQKIGDLVTVLGSCKGG
jgi:acyl carrier protein